MNTPSRITHRYNHAGQSRQTGAALIVSMVLIFLLSILGLSSMRSSTLENRLVGNSLEKDLTFQAADSAGELSLDDENNLLAVVCDSEAFKSDITQVNKDGLLETTATVGFGGQAPAVGFSLDANLTNFRFTTTGTATLIESGTSTSVTQGVTILGARAANGAC